MPGREETVERNGGLSIQIPGDKADLSCFSPTPAEHPKNMARTERFSRKQMALRHAITARLSVAQESIVAPVVIVLSSTSTVEDSILQLLNLVEIFYPSHSLPQISTVLNCLAGSATGTEEQYSLEAHHMRLKMWRPAGITEEMIGKKGAPEVLYIPFA